MFSVYVLSPPSSAFYPHLTIYKFSHFTLSFHTSSLLAIMPSFYLPPPTISYITFLLS